MKILHICAGNLYGGVESMLATIAREQEACPGFSHDFALCFSSRLAEELTAAGHPPHILGAVKARQPWSVVAARSRLAALLRARSYDAVVTHMPWVHAIFSPVARRAGMALIHWMHNLADGRLSNWIERWARLTPPDLVVANSHFTAATLPLLFPRRAIPCEIVPCPVSFKDLILGRDETDAIRESMETPRDAVVIIQVSRMEPWKGHDLHIEALATLTDLPMWRLWIVGGAQRQEEERYAARLKKKVDGLGLSSRARFIGERSDVPRLLRAADIYCQPNRDPECFGISFVEAMDAGLPVVTTAQGGVIEIIGDACGLAVAPNSVLELSAALRRLILEPDLRRALGGEGPVRAREICSSAKSLGRLRDAITQHLKPKIREAQTVDSEKPIPRRDEPSDLSALAHGHMSGASIEGGSRK